MDVLKNGVLFVSANLHKVRIGAVAFALLGITTVLCSPIFAQNGTVDVQIPDVDYAGVITSVLGYAATAILAAIGLGLSIWGARYLYRLFKGMAK
ncbi:MAG: hypothetical protein LBQ54_14515 [Planctomycetaceae bacterium]|jgi:hypothetical protein|nr:hypothetical protein [Planctomycetaceae bacterium]